MSGRVPTVVEIADTPVDQLPPLIHVPPLTKPFDVTIRPPGSKSLTNRALLLAALAEGESVLTGALAEADDAHVMVRALRQLGAVVDVTPEFEPNGESCGNATIRVKGVGGRWKIKAGETVTLNLNNAGTATRFLTAAAVLQPPESGGIVIDGNARMRERPIGELVDALVAAGLDVKYVNESGFPPVKVRPVGDADQQTLSFEFGTTQSSQFISAVHMLGPFLSNGLRVRTPTVATSEQYIRMTRRLLDGLGATTKRITDPTYTGPSLAGGRRPCLHGFRYAVEADASSATYFAAAGLICPNGRVRLSGEGFRPLSAHEGYMGIARDGVFLQPDFRFIDWASDKQFGGQRPKTGVNMASMPDAAMTMAVVCCFTEDVSELTGLRTLRVKETDRIAALVIELAKVGVKVEPFADGDDEAIRITPPPGGTDCSPTAPRVEFDTYDDHRMAMSLALIGLRRPNVYIRDPACVRKTYPTYWRDLAKLYA